MAKRRKQSGQGVDAWGGPVIDPTANVIALTEAANKRQDDLRLASEQFFGSKIDALSSRIDDFARAQAKLSKKESQRIDSIRRVDREDVNKIAATATTTAETLRAQVATTAGAAQTSLANSMAEVNKRLSAVELSLSEGRGKATVESPMMAEMVSELKALRREQSSVAAALSNTSGQKQGALSAREMISWILLTLVGLYTLNRSIKP